MYRHFFVLTPGTHGILLNSGTKAFVDKAQGESDQAKELDAIIGQFGVGFYSAFMVADEVKVFSRGAGDAEESGHCWTSSGLGTSSCRRRS